MFPFKREKRQKKMRLFFERINLQVPDKAIGTQAYGKQIDVIF